MNNEIKIKTVSIRFIETKAVVWQGTYADYVRDFNGGLDEDNRKTFELVIED